MQKKQRATRHRSIDLDVENTYKDLRKRFALVSKMRANIWVTTALVVFFIGLVMGTAYVIDPSNLPIGQLRAMVGLAKLQTNTSTPNVAGNAGFYGNPTTNIPTNGGGGASNTGCVRNQLTVGLTPISQQTPAGQAKPYTVKVTNNDVGCSPVSFIITSQASRQYQSTGTVQTTGGTISNVAAGTSGTTNITATPSANASGEFIINITAKHPISAGYNDSLGANLLVGTGCIDGHPRITIVPSGNNNKNFSYSVTNGDSSACPSSSFIVKSEAGTPTITPTTFSLAPGAIRSGTATIPSTSTQPNIVLSVQNTRTTQTWSASIPIPTGSVSDGGATGDCKVKPTVTVSPEQATNTASFTVTVKNNDTSACGSGLFNITGRPNESTDLTKWQQQPPTAGGTIAPGATKTFSFSVNGTSAAAGTYNYLFSVKHPNDLGGSLTGNAFARFCVGASGTSCSGGGTGGGGSNSAVDLKIKGSDGPTVIVSNRENFTISWSSPTGTSSCSIFPHFPRSERPEWNIGTSGSLIVNYNGGTGAANYTLTCATPAGSQSDTVRVEYGQTSSTNNSTSFWRRVLDFINPN
jgi:hypothetical protein